MTTFDWQLTIPITAVVFDCDGTLTHIEGIDELAKENNVNDEVKFLTQEAMGKTGLNPDLYKKRLDLVLPFLQQVEQLGKNYFHHRVPRSLEIIQCLHRLNKSIYMVSAGLAPAVEIFGKLLSVPEENIYSVKIKFDAYGRYEQYDQSSPLIHNDGKKEIVAKIKKNHPRIIYVGDGLNDITVYDLVTRFIGYGGTFFRQNIADRCQFYLNSPSLSALLPLILTHQESEKLNSDEKSLYQEGLAIILQGKMKGISRPRSSGTFEDV